MTIPSQSVLCQCLTHTHYSQASSHILIRYPVLSCHPTHHSQHFHLCHLQFLYLLLFDSPTLGRIFYCRSNCCRIKLPLQLHWHLPVAQHSFTTPPLQPSCLYLACHFHVYFSTCLQHRPQILVLSYFLQQ